MTPRLAATNDAPIIVEVSERILSLTLARPRGNILDGAMIAALRSALSEHGRNPSLRALLLLAEGEDFSWGASVKEHQREEAPAMLAALHGLFHDLLTLCVPCVAAVHGQCLGGGFELALCASFVIASPGVRFGLPEIKVGVFAPFASAILPLKIGQAHAERLLLGVSSIDAKRAREIGLVDEVAEDAEGRARGLIEEAWIPRSAVALRFALRAARARLIGQLDETLAELERVYLDELMATHDANEGIAAFLGKRPAVWKDR